MQQALVRSLSRASSALAALALAGPGTSQVFVSNTDDIPLGSPVNNSWTENLEFGDADLDGDWDVIFADGSDSSNDQNRIWINQGGLQSGTLGAFFDETDTRFPAVLDDSRDIEFADIDGDGDLDIATSNTSSITAQSNRWWINQGGLQAGGLGYFVDETQERWVGLGTGSSSVHPQLVLAGGGFIDYTADSDFGDLDDDGDLDLVHSAYGGAFTGLIQTRIFLNDGAGSFTEHNPSTYVPTEEFANGVPAIWCEGVQQHNTEDATGAEADIALTVQDLEVVDLDGDFDADLILGPHQDATRFYQNRMIEDGGFSVFRDVTYGVLPAEVIDGLGNGSYDFETGDLDRDGDLDLFGLSWSGWDDLVLRFDSNALSFGDATILADSGQDDNEGDFLDFDNDGWLDVFVPSFSGGHKLYHNVDTGSGPIGMGDVANAVDGPTGGAWDADGADVDGDGDTDVFVARWFVSSPNLYLENTTQIPDTHAPYVPSLESLSSAVASAGERVVHAQVYDNAPFYITAYAQVELEVGVDGCPLPESFPMSAGANNLWRGELPANLVGAVSYHVRATDEHGNSGVSTVGNYTSTGAAGSSFGCSATSLSTGLAPRVRALSEALPGTTLYVGGDDLAPGAPYVLAIAGSSIPCLSLPGLAQLNLGPPTWAVLTGSADADGCAGLALPLSAGTPGGAALYFQLFTVDPASNGDLLSSSQGLAVTVSS